jgi:hypothetical protein
LPSKIVTTNISTFHIKSQLADWKAGEAQATPGVYLIAVSNFVRAVVAANSQL